MRTMLFCAVALMLSPAAAVADDDPREGPIIELLNHYAQSAGLLSSCGKGPSDDGIQPLADQIAEWKYPGLYGWMLSPRSDFATEIAADALREYRLASLKPCHKTFVGSTEMLLRSAKSQIERTTGGN